MVTTSSIHDGPWSASNTWDVRVPEDGDLVVLTDSPIVDFDVDQSGFSSGLAGLAIHGTLRTDSDADRYLKVNADITGVGVWSIDDGAGGDWPTAKQMTIDLGGGSNSIVGSDGLELNFRCAEPDNQFVRLSAPELAGQTELSVNGDVTGDKWKVGDTVWIANIDNGLQVEERIIQAIGVNTITITAGLTADKLEGSYIILQNRNARIINSTDYAIKNVSGSTIGIEINGCLGGYLGCINNIIYGSVCGVVNALHSSHGSIFSGAAGGNGIFWNSSNNCIMSGIAVGNSIFGTVSHSGILSGIVAGGSTGFSRSNNTTVTGDIIGCTRGVVEGSIQLFDATLDCVYTIERVIQLEAYNTLFGEGVEFRSYDDITRAPWLYSFSRDHDRVPGAYKAWVVGGIVTNDTGIKPPGEIQSFKHACEDADNPVFMQDRILIQPGDTFVYAVDARKDASMSFLPRAQLLLPEEDPLVDASNTPLDEAIMTNSIDTWEELSLTYENTTDYPVEVLIRTLAMSSSDNAWFLVQGGKFADVVDVDGSTLDAVANDGTGTSATLTITPPASGLYEATKTRYREINTSIWFDGGDFVGSQGVQGTHQITGLSNNTSYEFFVVAFFGTSNAFPSDILRVWVSSDTGPIVEQILDDIKTSIEMITTANGYSQTIESGNVVRREGTPWTEFACYPAVDLWLVQEIKTDEETMGRRDVHMEVEIRAYVYDSNDIDQALSKIVGDIENALAVDHTRGGFAIDTDIDEVEHIFADDSSGKPNGMVTITLDIKYWHLRNDTYN